MLGSSTLGLRSWKRSRNALSKIKRILDLWWFNKTMWRAQKVSSFDMTLMIMFDGNKLTINDFWFLIKQFQAIVESSHCWTQFFCIVSQQLLWFLWRLVDSSSAFCPTMFFTAREIMENYKPITAILWRSRRKTNTKKCKSATEGTWTNLIEFQQNSNS